MSKNFKTRGKKYLFKFDRFIRTKLYWQLFWIIIATAGIVGLCWLMWSKSGTAESSYYDMYVHAVNPQYSNALTSTGNQIITIILYFFVGIGIAGLFFTTIVNIYDRRKEKWAKGLVDYDIVKDFFLIIGGHNMVPQLCRDIIVHRIGGYGDYKILIMTQDDVEALRQDISSKIDEKEMKRIVIYRGNRTEMNDLKRLNPQFANEIFIIGEEGTIDGESHDTANLESLKKINDIIVEYDNSPQKNIERPHKIECHVMFSRRSTSSIFLYTDLNLSSRLEFIPFNFAESWARRVLITDTEPSAKNNPYGYSRLFGNERLYGANNRKRVHLIVVGMSHIGTAIATEAAHLCHFPNFVQNKTDRPRTLITFIDQVADEAMSSYINTYPAMYELARYRYVATDNIGEASLRNPKHLYCPLEQIGRDKTWRDPLNDTENPSKYIESNLGKDLVDIDWEFIKGEITHPDIRQYFIDAAKDEDCITTIAVCFSSSNKSMRCALLLPQEALTSKNLLQVLVLQEHYSAAIEILNKELTLIKDDITYHADNYVKLKPFGMRDECRYLGVFDDWTPKLTSALYQEVADKQNGDVNNKEPYKSFIRYLFETKRYYYKYLAGWWNQITNDKGKTVLAKKWSNIYCADTAEIKAFMFDIKEGYDQLSVDDEDTHIMAEVEHYRWNVEQLLTGYRPKLPGENLPSAALKLRKIHNCIRSYDQLDDYTKLYDIVISQSLPLMLLFRRKTVGKKRPDLNNFI